MVSRRARREAVKIYKSISNLIFSDIPTEYKNSNLRLAKKIHLKTRVKPPKYFKIFYCKKCKSVLLPGVNAIYRLRSRPYKNISIKCLECGHVYRLGYSKFTKD